MAYPAERLQLPSTPSEVSAPSIEDLRLKYEVAFSEDEAGDHLTFEEWLIVHLHAAECERDASRELNGALDVNELRRLIPFTFVWVPPTSPVHLQCAKALASPKAFDAAELHSIMSQALEWVPAEAAVRASLCAALKIEDPLLESYAPSR